MSLAIQRMAAVAAACMILTMTVSAPAQGQAEPGRWLKMAPFPEPEEELYGVAANGKMYVLGGFGVGGKPVGMVWEYDPATDNWNKKKNMPLPVHHQAMTEYRGKIYMFGGFVQYPVPGQPLAGWEPVNNVWEYDPGADSWKALAPMPSKRGSAVATEVSGKKIGRAHV